MKKVKFFNLIVCLLIFAGMAGCSDDTPPPSNRDDFDLKKINYRSHFTNPYDTIGKYHNEALASVFKEYLKLPRAKSSAEEKERFDNDEFVYLECTDEECGNSFYLEKGDEI